MSHTFQYDPFGRRIEKISPTTTSIFVYEGDNLVQTVNSTGGLVARYTQTTNIDEPLAMQRGGTSDWKLFVTIPPSQTLPGEVFVHDVQ